MSPRGGTSGFGGSPDGAASGANPLHGVRPASQRPLRRRCARGARADLQDDLDPEHHEADRRADDEDRDRREVGHLLERVLRHRGADEPDRRARRAIIGDDEAASFTRGG